MTGPGLRTALPELLRQYRVFVAVAVALVAGLGVLAATPIGRAEILRSVTRQPEPFVALHFADPPVRVTGSQLTVDFVVEQHDGGPAPYLYRIAVRDPEGTVLAAAEGTAEPAPGAPAHITRSLTLPRGAAWERVEVTLPGRTESLYVRDPGSAS
ncbi:hypothetical protein SAMN05443637_12175 [Pseudonocardia thermophila]|jgi:hypothetical protein|uniref:DUF1616 domain-containing protein n=1 Tax=Pseudonocardia thermophila TaxID=1848 RepID=A0A1M6YU47_PSETH|nr:hypothetical protein [Pseudonocardia thermophila]SHL21796.1 hypothetical protein SAMN05443637_12175 [Pseudonocardia thermophila]